MATYAEEVAADNPVVWLPMQETSGTTVSDDGSATTDGTYVNTPTLGEPGPITGDPANDAAVRFSAASSEHLFLPHVAAHNLGNGPFTIEWWMKRASTGTNQVVHGKGSGPPATLIDTTGQIEFYAGNVGLHTLSTINITDTTTWHHVVITRDPGASPTTHLYIDGVDRTGTITARTFSDDADDYLVVGADNPNGGTGLGLMSNVGAFFDGHMAHFAIYDAALSPTRVSAHYDAADESPGVALAPAATTDVAQAISFTKPIHGTLVPSAETTTALPVDFVKPIHGTLVLAAEADVPRAVTLIKVLSIGPASEASPAVFVGLAKQVSLASSAEVDEAAELFFAGNLVLVPAVDVSSAGALVLTKVASIIPAEEADEAGAAARAKVLPITPSVEVTQAALVSSQKLVEIASASEVAQAVVLALAPSSLPGRARIDFWEEIAVLSLWSVDDIFLGVEQSRWRIARQAGPAFVLTRRPTSQLHLDGAWQVAVAEEDDGVVDLHLADDGLDLTPSESSGVDIRERSAA